MLMLPIDARSGRLDLFRAVDKFREHDGFLSLSDAQRWGGPE